MLRPDSNIVSNDALQIMGFFCQIEVFLFVVVVVFGTEHSHRNKINQLLTYEAENCRPFYMQTLPASEGNSWNKNETTNE